MDEILKYRPEEQDNLPEFPDETLLLPIASLGPDSGEAAAAFVEPAGACCLQQNDWAALKRLAVECAITALGWMEKLADAVLELERYRHCSDRWGLGAKWRAQA